MKEESQLENSTSIRDFEEHYYIILSKKFYEIKAFKNI